MRYKIAAVLLAVMASLGLAISAPGKASAMIAGCGSNHTVNIAYNGKWYWNNWNGTQVNGNHVNFNNVPNDGYNDWCLIQLGTVTNQSPVWPFADGSGLNTRYNGRPVYQLCWQINQSYCIDWGQYDDAIHNGRAIVYSGADQRLYEAVLSSSNYWAPVWPNDLEYALGNTGLLPILLGTQNGTIGQGGGLWMNPSGGKELQFPITDPALVCQIHC